jgi:hypothetical protein
MSAERMTAVATSGVVRPSTSPPRSSGLVMMLGPPNLRRRRGRRLGVVSGARWALEPSTRPHALETKLPALMPSPSRSTRRRTSARLAPQGHADCDLLRASADRVRHHAKNSHRRKHERRGRKDPQQGHRKANRPKSPRDDIVHGAGCIHGLLLVERSHGIAGSNAASTAAPQFH